MRLSNRVKAVLKQFPAAIEAFDCGGEHPEVIEDEQPAAVRSSTA